MAEPKVARTHEWADHARLALAHTRVAEEGIGVHQSQLIEEQPQRALVPALIGQAALGQQRLEARLARASRLLRLPNVR